ncbi:hypothetical protein BDV34DRAFT_197182 [Aspergillus parasiticus]|uniref:Uncharacterized protein n=1 Tax=Aspergillus parasiticus TaxID=5067 RepID=A0A5N6DHY8_ASPPA|nr:hypothetical protein BDV34DRAFT_197182 [Aspergillus parasiticus]
MRAFHLNSRGEFDPLIVCCNARGQGFAAGHLVRQIDNITQFNISFLEQIFSGEVLPISEGCVVIDQMDSQRKFCGMLHSV